MNNEFSKECKNCEHIKADHCTLVKDTVCGRLDTLAGACNKKCDCKQFEELGFNLELCKNENCRHEQFHHELINEHKIGEKVKPANACNLCECKRFIL